VLRQRNVESGRKRDELHACERLRLHRFRVLSRRIVPRRFGGFKLRVILSLLQSMGNAFSEKDEKERDPEPKQEELKEKDGGRNKTRMRRRRKSQTFRRRKTLEVEEE